MIEPTRKFSNFYETSEASPEDQRRLMDLVKRTLPQVKVQRISQVNNKYLSRAFNIRKFQYRQKNELELLHATSSQNVESILHTNLNWRLVKRSRFGKGVSFSNSACYANEYCNKNNGTQRAFIVCKVLIGIIKKVGKNDHECPSSNVDTYRSFNRPVWVKFDDFTFNPKFVIYYSWSKSAGGPCRNPQLPEECSDDKNAEQPAQSLRSDIPRQNDDNFCCLL